MRFTVVFCFFLGVLFDIGCILSPNSAHKAWFAMAFSLALAPLAAVFKQPIEIVRVALGGEKTVDIVLCWSAAIFALEIFLSRFRGANYNEQFADFFRQIAIAEATRL